MQSYSWPAVALVGDDIYIAWTKGHSNVPVIQKWDGSIWQPLPLLTWQGDTLVDFVHMIALENDILASVWTDAARQQLFVALWHGEEWVLLGESSVTHSLLNPPRATQKITYSRLVALDDNHFYLAWRSMADEEAELNVIFWNGEAWLDIGQTLLQNIQSNPISDLELALAPDGTLYLAWVREGSPGSYELYLQAWNGNIWQEVGNKVTIAATITTGNETRIPISTSLAVLPDGTLFVGWTELSLRQVGGLGGINASHGPVRVKQWDGFNWHDIGAGLSNNDGIDGQRDAYSPKLVAYGEDIYLAWSAIGEQGREIYLQRWTGSDWQDVGYDASRGESVSYNQSFSDLPDVAIVDDKICVTWLDDANTKSSLQPQIRWPGRLPEISLLKKDVEHAVYLRCYWL